MWCGPGVWSTKKGTAWGPSFFKNLMRSLTKKKWQCVVCLGKQCIVYHSPEYDHYSGQNTHLQIIFDLKHLGNIIGTLINQSMASENVKNHPKIHKQPEIKNLPQLRSIFRYFQGKNTQS